MLRKILLAAMLALGLAATAPGGASAAPLSPGLALPAGAAPAQVEKAQFYYGPRFYRPYRPYYRPYYRRRFYYGGPRYYRPYYRRRFYY